MLDLNFVRENIEAVQANIKNRFMKVDTELVKSLSEKRTSIIIKLESIRSQRNAHAEKMSTAKDTDVRNELITQGKQFKISIAEEEKKLEEIEAQLNSILINIPNMAHPQAPIGKEDKDNLEIKRVGTPTTFSFSKLDHIQLGEKLGILDFDAGTKVSGTKFYYLKNEGVFLELALIRFAMDELVKKGFTAYITPDIAKEEVLTGIGFNPRGEESNIYTIEGTGTCLVGTAEITLGGYYSKQIIDLKSKAIRMAGLSHCFRREAGAHGQFSKGLYRVHQFTKVEMFVICLPEMSESIHQQLLEIEESLFTQLEIPYRVVDTCTGDLGASAYRKFDLEAWMPGRGEEGDWGEVTSTSNCTDYQARRLGIRYKADSGQNSFPHMLNGTAIATSRAIIALLENHQRADCSVRIPKALVPYTGFETIKPKV